MRCIFCKRNSKDSKSEEHIIPESLGNKEHKLPKGFVCDSCNNYIARKIEKPFLETPFFMNLRFRQGIINKKGRTPILSGLHLGSNIIIQLDGNDESIYPQKEADGVDFLKRIQSQKTFTLFFSDEKPSAYITSRFICKIAFEALFYKILQHQEYFDELIDKPELEPIRKYIRHGSNSIWEFNERTIYDEDTLLSENDDRYQLLHEFLFLQTQENEYIFVIAIFGIEYAISLDNPSIISYKKWLENNNNKSPLQT